VIGGGGGPSAHPPSKYAHASMSKVTLKHALRHSFPPQCSDITDWMINTYHSENLPPGIPKVCLRGYRPTWIKCEMKTLSQHQCQQKIYSILFMQNLNLTEYTNIW